MDVWADCFRVNVFFLRRNVRKNGWGLDPLGRIACGFLGRATHRCKDDSGLPGRAVARPFGRRAPVPQSPVGLPSRS
jgi:hypothetical protein